MSGSRRPPGRGPDGPVEALARGTLSAIRPPSGRSTVGISSGATAGQPLRWRSKADSTARSDAVVAGADSLDAIAANPAFDGQYPNLRWILVHMIEEYARHCGHADFIRESIDGRTGD